MRALNFVTRNKVFVDQKARLFASIASEEARAPRLLAISPNRAGAIANFDRHSSVSRMRARARLLSASDQPNPDLL